MFERYRQWPGCPNELLLETTCLLEDQLIAWVGNEADLGF